MLRMLLVKIYLINYFNNFNLFKDYFVVFSFEFGHSAHIKLTLASGDQALFKDLYLFVF